MNFVLINNIKNAFIISSYPKFKEKIICGNIWLQLARARIVVSNQHGERSESAPRLIKQPDNHILTPSYSVITCTHNPRRIKCYSVRQRMC